jgi:tricarballylate dehydrogenase
MLDVLVVGGGNAALCAALTAREAGASVLLPESAPRAWRGSNSPPATLCPRRMGKA